MNICLQSAIAPQALHQKPQVLFLRLKSLFGKSNSLHDSSCYLHRSAEKNHDGTDLIGSVFSHKSVDLFLFKCGTDHV